MLSRINAIVLLSMIVSASAAFAQPNDANTNRVTGRNAVHGAVRTREAPENAPVARPNSPGGVGVRPGEVGPLQPHPEDPEIDPGVYEPTDFTIPGYGTTQVGLRWWNNGGPRTQIFRSISAGPWTLLQTYGALPTGGYIDFQDQGAAVSAENCYRVAVSDGVNSSSTKTSPIRCAMTRDARTIPVHRLQLRIQIASAADADTDNTIEVRLQSPTSITYANTYWRPAGNSTWVDSTADDFERSTNRTYDLMLANISDASDITQITLAKPGDDQVCVAGLELLVDNVSAFSRTYGNSATACQWIRGDNVLSVGFAELRAHPSWVNLSPNTLTKFSGPAFRSIIEAKFGHFLHGRGELQTGLPVTTSRAAEDRLNVSVPVTIYDVPLLGDVDSYVHFDLVLTNTSGGGDQLTVEHVDADSSDLLGFFLPVFGWALLNGTSEEIESQIRGMGPTNVGGSPLGGTHLCFAEDGGLDVCY